MIRFGKCLLSDRLKEARMSQRELSERIGKAESTICDYIKGRTKMSTLSMISISFVLNCDPRDLYEWIRE